MELIATITNYVVAALGYIVSTFVKLGIMEQTMADEFMSNFAAPIAE